MSSGSSITMCRQHSRMKDDLLGVIRRIGDHGCAADFRARAGGRRHGHDGRHAMRHSPACTSPRDLRSRRGDATGPTISAMALPTSSALPPPKAMTPSCLPLRNAATPCVTFSSTGFACISREHRAPQPGACSTSAPRPSPSAAWRAPGSVTSSGRAHAERLACIGQLTDAARAEANGGRIVPVAFEVHRSSSRCASRRLESISRAQVKRFRPREVLVAHA